MTFRPHVTEYRPTTALEGWVAHVPAVRALRSAGVLGLYSPVTVIMGENGVGKSTLLESIAAEYGFGPDGGPFGWERANYKAGPLFGAGVLSLGDRPKDGYYLQSETHFNVATKFGNSGPGVSILHAMSHGESVMKVVQESFGGRGLYILDEPESGLSLVSQMALLAEIHLSAQAGAQFIVATHSPVLAAIPGAALLEFTERATIERPADVTETRAFRVLRDFVADPVEVGEFMVEVARR